MSERNLSQWLDYLEALHPRKIDLGLERITAVAERMNLRPVSVPVITVAGTNGKGSTITTLEALAVNAGLRCGVFTSPHFLRYNERIRVSGREADDAGICDAFEAIDRDRGDISLSYFEFSFLAALWLFKRDQVDAVFLEVGLGGRLDAVNCIDADVAVITSIALDHQHMLGDTREQIAIEKAGIARKNKPLVLAEPDPPANLLPHLHALNVQLLALHQDFAPTDAGGFYVNQQGRQELAGRAPIAGVLPVNVAAALQAFAVAGFSLPDIIDGHRLLPQGVTGRRQSYLFEGKTVLLDVAHNEAAVIALADYLAATPVKGKTIALFNAMSDKDIRGMIRAVSAQVDTWWLTALPDTPRAAAPKDVLTLLRDEGVSSAAHLADHPVKAFACACETVAEADRLVVFGSFFTVAPVLPLLNDSGRQTSERPD